MEERTLDDLWEKIGREEPVLWAQMEKFYGPMSRKILLMEENQLKHRCKPNWRLERWLYKYYGWKVGKKHGGKTRR